MANPTRNNPDVSSRALTLIGMITVVAVLYFAREVLIPITLAVLLTFVLAPLTEIMQRRLHLGRIVSSLVAALLGLGALTILTYVLFDQAVDLADKIPQYKDNIKAKMQTLRTHG